MKQILSALSLLVCFSVFGVLPPYPIGISANKRYFVDASGVPWLMNGDSPHGLMVEINNTDAAYYIQNRKTNSFNAILVQALWKTRSDWSLLDGTLPFSGTIAGGYYDLTKPNNIYFNHLDYIVNTSATNGIVVIIDPLDTSQGLSTAQNNGSNSCYSFGLYLGNRYKGSTNIMWQSGNDYAWNNSDDVYIKAIADGIKAAGDMHLQSIEITQTYPWVTSMYDPNWWTVLQFNEVYLSSPTYVGVLQGYDLTNYIPVILGEGHYELEVGGSPSSEMGTPLIMRHQAYWTTLSGGAGQLYGNHYTWTFAAGWQSNLDTAGATGTKHWFDLMNSRRWQNMVPDVNHQIVTAGYGTAATTNDFTVLNSANDYVTTAYCPDGSLAMAYTPVSHDLVVDLSQFSGGRVAATWYDPTTGGWTNIPGSPFSAQGTFTFTPPSNNGAGDGDWVLLLEVTNSEAPVSLGSAGNFAVLAGSSVTSTGNTIVDGDLGVLAGTAVIGFAGIPPGGPGTANGTIHAGDAVAQTAQGDLTTAYNDAAGRTLNPVDVSNADLGGRTLPPGLYNSSGTLAVTGALTLDAQGDTNAVFIFQVASSLNTAPGSQVILSGGANAANIYWQVGGSAMLGATTVFKGNILANQSISLATGATLDGRALARIAAVTLSANRITSPAPTVVPSWTMWWQHTDGWTAKWTMNGINSVHQTRLNAARAGLGWNIVGTGHFSGPGRTDLLWQNSSGWVAIWLLDETNFTGGMRLNSTPVGPGWKVVGTGDFVGDGQTDILWQSTSGSVAVWFMNGTNFLRSARLNSRPVDPGWIIVGAGDFRGGGNTDILWKNAAGITAMWLMDHTNVVTTLRLSPPPVAAGWRVVGCADVNADGHLDIVWQKDTGVLAYWLLNGTNFLGSGHLNPEQVDPVWRAVGTD